MNNLLRLLSVLMILLLSFSVLHADVAKGKALYVNCVACHMDKGQGNVTLKAPSIAGQELDYMKRQIHKFKSGIRGSHPKDTEGLMMKPMMLMLKSDEDINNVAEYIHSLKPVKPATTLKGDVAKGKTLYATCAACHGQDGKGVAAMKSPSLLNLPDWYMLRQLKKFKEGIRGAHPKDLEGMQMAPMAKMLADEQAMKDVIAYIHSLSTKK